jgi:hypothetical protein
MLYVYKDNDGDIAYPCEYGINYTLYRYINNESSPTAGLVRIRVGEITELFISPNLKKIFTAKNLPEIGRFLEKRGYKINRSGIGSTSFMDVE